MFHLFDFFLARNIYYDNNLICEYFLIPFWSGLKTTYKIFCIFSHRFGSLAIPNNNPDPCPSKKKYESKKERKNPEQEYDFYW